MACVNPDGTLSASAASILKALASSADLDEVARTTGLPLFRVRAAVRELSQAQLVEEAGESVRPTAAGAKLAGSVAS
jgi:DNA-binding IclR family transcriptional regulator